MVVPSRFNTEIGVDYLIRNDTQIGAAVTSSTNSNTSATKSNSPPPPDGSRKLHNSPPILAVRGIMMS
jgi:hypothetical protein